MKFHSFECEWQSLLIGMIENPFLHSRWLNTLSFWENCGARKLAACEHPTKVKEEMLKHASEEFRHAYHLKQQIHRLSVPFLYDYHWASLLGGIEAYHYLQRLDILICRLLKEEYGLGGGDLRSLAYLLVTYAIEHRAEEVYSLYHAILKQSSSPIRIHSILLEEKEHLAEIEKELFDCPFAHVMCQEVHELEGFLCQKWVTILKTQVFKKLF